MKSGEWSRCKTRTRRSGQVVLHGYTLALRYRDQLKVGGEEYCAHSNLYDDKLKLKFYSYSQAGLVVPCPGTGH